MNKIFYFLCASWALSGLSCEQSVCESLETRCNDNKVQICNTSGKWTVVHDCNFEGNGWICIQPYGEEAECKNANQTPEE